MRLVIMSSVVFVGTSLTVAEAQPLERSEFLETFELDSPASPAVWRPGEWDVTVHSRDGGTWQQLQGMDAQHGSDCGAPPATHPISTYEEAVFQCRDHLMTAINASGYGVIYLTPNQVVDFSGGEAVIRFDVSTARTSGRDWIDLWVTPYDEHLQLPLQSWLPDLSGPPRRSLQLRMDASSGQTIFKATAYRDFVEQNIDGNWWTGYQSFLTPSATTRTTFELRLSRTHVKFGMPAYNFWWIDAAIADLGWERGVVQLGHHSYTPGKDCPAGQTCGPNTWHWDNVSISPAEPFTIVKANRHYVDQTTPGEVSFAAPAPPNAQLRFTAQSGQPIQVSFDGGASWQAGRIQPAGSPKGDHFQSYWMPIPAGVQRIQVKGSGGYWGGSWMARDFSLWALGSVELELPDQPAHDHVHEGG
jgi:hypothetical protein